MLVISINRSDTFCTFEENNVKNMTLNMGGVGNMLTEAQGAVQQNETLGVWITQFIDMKVEVAYNITRWNGLIREEC